MNIDYLRDRPNWTPGLSQNNTPLLTTAEEFLQYYDASSALNRFFTNNPEFDCPHNRKTLGHLLFINFRESGRSLYTFSSNGAIRDIMAVASRRRAFLTKVEETKTTSVAVSIFKFLGNVFFNVITLGLYGIIKNALQDKAIKQLELQNGSKDQFRNEILMRLRRLFQDLQNQPREVQSRNTAIQNAQREIQAMREEINNLPYNDERLARQLLADIHVEEEKIRALHEKEHELRTERDQNEAAAQGMTREGGKGWLKPAFKIKSTDVKRIDPTFSPETNSCKTMIDLLKVEFQLVTKDLLRDSQNDPQLHFNRSSKIIDIDERVLVGGNDYQQKFVDTRDAIYKAMAFRMICKAGMKRTNESDAVLTLNAQGLTVRSSEPFWANPQEALFKHHDAWTPPLDQFSNGVDPISIKFFMHELSRTGNLGKLYNLLLAPLWGRAANPLKEAKKIFAKDDKTGEVFRAIEPLINDVAAMLRDRYQGDLDAEWANFFNDANAVPFYKDPNEIETVDINQEEEIMRITEWKPEILEIAAVSPGVIDDLTRTRNFITPIWKNIETVIANPQRDNSRVTTINDLSNLTDQYWYVHLLIDGQGCLPSALALSLFQGATGRDKVSPQRIKECLADWLEAGAGECFKSTISAETGGWGCERYVKYLRGQAEGYAQYNHMGSLEIDLLSRALGLHIEVFTSARGGSYAVKGGLKTSVTHYGAANAKERITLYCKENYSWYALFPKVRRSNHNDSLELKTALNRAHEYWEKNNGLDLVNWSNFRFPA